MRRLHVPLALADALFGSEPGDQKQASAALSKLWGTIPTGRATVLEVRVGWIAGRQYMQFVERPTDDVNKCMASVLFHADALPALAEHLAALVRHERSW